MFLSRNWSYRIWRVLPLLVVAGLRNAWAAEPFPPCFVDVPLYSASGDKINARIVAVTPESQREIDLLTSSNREHRVVVQGDRIYFGEAQIGKSRIEITLVDAKGEKIKRRIPLMACQQRVSLEYGLLDRGFDVAYSTVTGRLVGCSLVGDWWIRALPMFGAHENPTVHDGWIRLSDGVFSITGSFAGERHIIIIGKGKYPIKTLAFDIVSGGDNNIGTIDLRDLCRQ